MRRITFLFVFILSFGLFSNSVFSLTKQEQDKIKQQIIDNSIRSYKGNCPCPYSKMKNGRTCGKTSAYSKKGGKSPICYASDVTTKMIENFKK